MNFCKQIEFLGNIITIEGIKPKPNKIKAIPQFPIPRTRREIN